jgi:uncharacterized protein involved in exopolysaccharide biosynthesis
MNGTEIEAKTPVPERMQRLAHRIEAIDGEIRDQAARVATSRQNGRSHDESEEFLQILRAVRASYADHLRVLEGRLSRP